jgi:hypothetical protein
MPVIEPGKTSDTSPKGNLKDLKAKLASGDLDVKPPFAPDEEKFPEDLAGKSTQERERYLTKGQRDKNTNDDSAVTLTPGPISVATSFPTQKQVYLDKSMWNIMNFGPTPKGGTAFGKPNLIAIVDGNNNFILDGHHRWSSAYISGGPQAKIKVQKLVGLDIPTAIAALRSVGNAFGNKQKG